MIASVNIVAELATEVELMSVADATIVQDRSIMRARARDRNRLRITFIVFTSMLLLSVKGTSFAVVVILDTFPLYYKMSVILTDIIVI